VQLAVWNVTAAINLFNIGTTISYIKDDKIFKTATITFLMSQYVESTTQHMLVQCRCTASKQNAGPVGVHAAAADGTR
jgi:hypothetical protein